MIFREDLFLYNWPQVFGNSVDYTDLLGEVVRDVGGRVVKAKAARYDQGVDSY